MDPDIFTASDALPIAYYVDDFTDPWKTPPTLFLLHAAMGSARRLYRWVPILARHFRVVRPDLRGHGKTGVPDSNQLSLERLTRDVIELAESGLPGFDFISWAGVVAPAGTPPQIVNKLNAEINRMLQTPDVKESLAAVGATPVGGSPEDFAKFIRKEVATWKEMVRITGARVD